MRTLASTEVQTLAYAPTNTAGVRAKFKPPASSCLCPVPAVTFLRTLLRTVSHGVSLAVALGACARAAPGSPCSGVCLAAACGGAGGASSPLTPGRGSGCCLFPLQAQTFSDLLSICQSLKLGTWSCPLTCTRTWGHRGAHLISHAEVC